VLLIVSSRALLPQLMECMDHIAQSSNALLSPAHGVGAVEGGAWGGELQSSAEGVVCARGGVGLCLDRAGGGGGGGGGGDRYLQWRLLEDRAMLFRKWVCACSEERETKGALHLYLSFHRYSCSSKEE
jgi:hypothetical protein